MSSYLVYSEKNLWFVAGLFNVNIKEAAHQIECNLIVTPGITFPNPFKVEEKNALNQKSFCERRFHTNKKSLLNHLFICQ